MPEAIGRGSNAHYIPVMIRYALACHRAHEFESWFPSSDAYDGQRARGLVTCPLCGSAEVEKQIMAPSVARSDRMPVGPVPVQPTTPDQPAEAAPPQPAAILTEREQSLRAMLKAFREHVTRNADYVGGGFAEEARKIHYGEAEHRSIYGEADPLEAKALLDEGIEFHPLPIIPDERN
jgi:hypothetical protein